MMTRRWKPRLTRGQTLGAAGMALLLLGAAGGAGAVSLTRPPVAMAPTMPTVIANLPATRGIVTVKAHVAAVYGDRVEVADQTGRALVDMGRAGDALSVGNAVMVQGRFDNGQLHARYLVDPAGVVQEVGPPPPHGGPGMRRGDPGAPPPPPPPPPGAGAPPPPCERGAPPPPPPPMAQPRR